MPNHTRMTDIIETSAEHAENAVLPTMCEVHVDPARSAPVAHELAPALQEPAASKSPAQWAYERIIMYIQNFEKQLDNTHEVGMGFVGGDAGLLRIEGLGYFDPDIVTFYGTDESGARTQLIQHVSQLNVTLRASPKHIDQEAPNRIGFQLASALQRGPAAAS